MVLSVGAPKLMIRRKQAGKVSCFMFDQATSIRACNLPHNHQARRGSARGTYRNQGATRVLVLDG